MSVENEVGLLEIVLALLSLAFMLWAGVVAWGVSQVIKRIDSISESVVALDKELSNWVKTTEGRLSRLEEWKDTSKAKEE